MFNECIAEMRGGSRAGHPVSNSKGLGRHLIVELFGCDPHILSDANLLDEILTGAALYSGATIVGKYFERFGEGGGVSAIVVIKESHISIHTWPELGYAALDIYTCGESIDPWKAYDLIVGRIEPLNVGAFEIIRGLNVYRNSRVSLQAREGKLRGG